MCLNAFFHFGKNVCFPTSATKYSSETLYYQHYLHICYTHVHSHMHAHTHIFCVFQFMLFLQEPHKCLPFFPSKHRGIVM